MYRPTSISAPRTGSYANFQVGHTPGANVDFGYRAGWFARSSEQVFRSLGFVQPDPCTTRHQSIPYRLLFMYALLLLLLVVLCCCSKLLGPLLAALGKLSNGELKTSLERHGRLPLQELLCTCDIWATLLRVIRRQGLEVELGFRIDDVLNFGGELEHGVLAGVTQVHRPNGFIVVHQTIETFNHVGNVAERAGLLTVTVDGQGLATQGLNNKVRNDTTIVLKHAGTVGVENSSDANLHSILTEEVEEECLSNPFALIVARANANWVHVTPVGLHLRVDIGITIHFRSRGEQNAGTRAACELEHVQRTHERRLGSANGVVLVEDWGGRASHVVDLIHFEVDRVNDIVSNELKPFVPNPVLDVRLLAREQVIQADDIVLLVLHEIVHHVGSDEARAARDQDASVLAFQVTGVKHRRRHINPNTVSTRPGPQYGVSRVL